MGWVGDATRDQVGGMGGGCTREETGWVGEQVGGMGGGGMLQGNKWVGWVGDATGTSGWDGWGMIQGNKWVGWVGDATREEVGGMGEQVGGMVGGCYKGTSRWDGWGTLTS